MINKSVTIAPQVYHFAGSTNLTDPVLTIQGRNITVDFQGTILQGTDEMAKPDQFKGIGILVKGENITIKNLTVKGYKIGLAAEECDAITIQQSDFSYNYRPRLASTFSKYATTDHNNIAIDFKKNGNAENWKNFGAGIFFNKVDGFCIKDNVIAQNQNGVVVIHGKHGAIFNNNITHNSGYGIATDQTSAVNIMHNYLDWNIRGFSNNHYDKTQGSGGIYHTSATLPLPTGYNSITHCGKNKLGTTLSNNDFFPFSADSLAQNNSSVHMEPLIDGKIIDNSSYPYQGKSYILIHEWGPYNFKYPTIWLRAVNGSEYTFTIFGPEGNWKLVNGGGFTQSSRQSGSVPATIVVTKAESEPEGLFLDLEFIGVEFIDQFGEVNPRGKTFKFGFRD